MVHSDEMDAYGVVSELRAAIKSAGSQTKFAARCGVSPQFVCDVLNGRRIPSGRLLAAIGMRRVVKYVRCRNPGGDA